jgi:hypothetical protein
MQDLNSIFSEFAEVFRGRLDDGAQLFEVVRLERSALDYTLDSLHALDRYLDHLHKDHERMPSTAIEKTVLWGGAYLGEVIRRQAPVEYNWIDYNDYMPQHPKLLNLIPERTVGTCAFLVGPGACMTMPLNKIARYIFDGPENNTHFYAYAEFQSHLRRAKKKRWWKFW